MLCTNQLFFVVCKQVFVIISMQHACPQRGYASLQVELSLDIELRERISITVAAPSHVLSTLSIIASGR